MDDTRCTALHLRQLFGHGGEHVRVLLEEAAAVLEGTAGAGEPPLDELRDSERGLD